MLDSVASSPSWITMSANNYLSLGILIFVAFAIIVGILYGLKRGVGKATFRLLTVLISLAGAIVITKAASGAFLSSFDGMTVGEAIRGFWADFDTALDPQAVNILNNLDGETAQHLLAMPVYLLVTPVMFVILFYVIKLVTYIVYFIFSLIFGFFKKKKSFLSRIGGALIGAVQGVIIAIVVLVPICGILGIATAAKPAVTAETIPEETRENIEHVYSEVIEPVTTSPAMTFISNLGASGIYSTLTDAKLGSHGYNLRKEAVLFVSLVGDVMALGPEFDWKDPVPYQSTIDEIVDDIGDNRYVSVLVSGTFRTMAYSAEDGLIELPEEEPYKSVMSDILQIFKTSDESNLKGDLVTLADVYQLLGKYDVLTAIESGDTQQMTEALTKKVPGSDSTVVSLINSELKKNERTKPLTVSLTKISVALLCEQVGISGDTAAMYEDVKSSINQVLTIDKSSYDSDEAYVEDLTQNLTQELESYDITLDEEVVKHVAEYINENNEQLSEITDDDINEIVFDYYDKYADYIASGDPADLPDADELPDINDIIGGGEIPEGVIPEGGSGSPE